MRQRRWYISIPESLADRYHTDVARWRPDDLDWDWSNWGSPEEMWHYLSYLERKRDNDKRNFLDIDGKIILVSD